MNEVSPFAPTAFERRREARERAVELLYEAEMKQCGATEVAESRPIPVDARALALIEGISKNLACIDQCLSEHLAQGWTLERLANCDRWILRQGVYELMQATEPQAAIISEAVALAGRYGATARSETFVNGVLAAIASEIESSKMV